MIAGSNVEISNKLTLQRRPGVSAYGTASIESPDAFYSWQLATTGDIVLIVDTDSDGANGTGRIRNYSPTYSGIYLDKGVGASQTNFMTIVNTLYFGNGTDLYKIIGPNLLSQSNTFGTGSGTDFSIQSPWTETDIFSLTPGQDDPEGGTNATQIIWSTTGSSVNLTQDVVPNYTPIASNTFTFSLWMKETGGAVSINLNISDQSGTVSESTFALTSTWTKYQVTATMNSGSTTINCKLYDPNSTNTMVIYGAQLEVGGPATTTQITTTSPQGVYLWGIDAPPSAPTLSFSNQVGNTGEPWQPNTYYSVGQTIVDSNGNLQYVIQAGTSGPTEPTWSTQQTTDTATPGTSGTTADGVQNAVVQTNQSYVTAAASTSVDLSSEVTASNSLFAFVYMDFTGSGIYGTAPTLTDNRGNTWSLVTGSSYGNNDKVFLFTVRSAAFGATDVTITAGGTMASIFAGIAEISGLTSLDVSNTNSAKNTAATTFTTGSITTTNANDFVITFAFFSNSKGTNTEVGVAPPGFTSIMQFGPQAASGSYQNGGVYFYNLAYTSSISPLWTISFPGGYNGLTGITAAYELSVPALWWANLGPDGAGLSPSTGYQYYYSFMNSHTGHVSNVSPISQSTGAVTGQIITVSGVGMQITPSGAYDEDPQVDTIAVFRNTDGGGFWYQIATFPNPGSTDSAETWNLSDIAPDDGVSVSSSVKINGTPQTLTEALNNEIYAPIGLLNSLPPTGMDDLEFFAGRMWGNVNNLLYYNTAADNASLINVTQNGVPSESWAPANVVPFNSPITRNLGVGGGLAVFTTTDMWFVTGQSLLTGGFNPQKLLVNHGLRDYNAVGLDGSTIYVFTADREFLCINPNSGSVEFGFPIGDILETDFDSTNAYVVRHVAGSRDNAVFLANGTSWYRLNPNQQGASLAGEQTPVWSPKADFSDSIGGISAIASIETSPGVIQLLVGQAATNSVPAPTIPSSISGTSSGDVNSFSITLTGVQVGDYIIMQSAAEATASGSNSTSVSISPNATYVGAVSDGYYKGSQNISYFCNIYGPAASAGSYTITVTFENSFVGSIEICAANVRGANQTAANLAMVASTLATNSPVTTSSTTAADDSTLVIGAGGMIGTGTISPNDSNTPLVNTANTGLDYETVNSGANVSSSWKQTGVPTGGATIATAVLFPPPSINTQAVLVRDLDIFSDNSLSYNWSATIGSILLAMPGKLAETESITVQMNDISSAATQCTVAVLLDEISGSFETLSESVPDPPNLAASTSVLSQRFYLMQGNVPPVCQNIQIQLSSASGSSTQDEILAITIRGALTPEQY